MEGRRGGLLWGGTFSPVRELILHTLKARKMKTFTMTIALVVSILANAQTAEEFKTYELVGDLVLQECDHTGAPLDMPASKFCSTGWRFSVVAQKDADYYIITFFDWYSSAELIRGEYIGRERWFKSKDTLDLDPELEKLCALYNYDTTRVEGLQERFFLITKHQLEKAAVPLTSRLVPVFGAMVLPFKYRPQTGVVTKDLGIGAIGGVQFRSNKASSVSLMFGATISSITVDSMSTEGSVIEPTEQGALSLPVGILFQWETLQVALLTGWDLMIDDNKDKWCYQGKQWFSLGVGVALFSSGGSASDKVQK